MNRSTVIILIMLPFLTIAQKWKMKKVPLITSCSIQRLDRSAFTMRSGIKTTVGIDPMSPATWTSSDSSIARVNNHGVVTVVSEGTATITARA